LDKNFASFANELNAAYKISDMKTVLVLEASPSTFTGFVKFLYTGYLFIDHPSLAYGGQENNPMIVSIGLLRLAHYLQAPDFRDALVDAMIEDVSRSRQTYDRASSLQENAVKEIHQYTATGAPLRTLAVDVCMRAWQVDEYERLGFTRHPVAFLNDNVKKAGQYINSVMELLDMPDPLDLELTCRYHEHSDSRSPCNKDKVQFLIRKVTETGKYTLRTNNAHETDC
jgi:hypothetical protein